MCDAHRPPACFAATIHKRASARMRGLPLIQRGNEGDFSKDSARVNVCKSPLPPFAKGGVKTPLPCAA